MVGGMSGNGGSLFRRRRKAHTIWKASSFLDGSAEEYRRRTKGWGKALTCTRMNLIIQKDAKWTHGILLRSGRHQNDVVGV